MVYLAGHLPYDLRLIYEHIYHGPCLNFIWPKPIFFYTKLPTFLANEKVRTLPNLSNPFPHSSSHLLTLSSTPLRVWWFPWCSSSESFPFHQGTLLSSPSFIFFISSMASSSSSMLDVHRIMSYLWGFDHSSYHICMLIITLAWLIDGLIFVIFCWFKTCSFLHIYICSF